MSREIISLILATAFISLGSSAVASDEARALKPIVVKGDTWTYRTVTSLGANTVVGLETVTVTFVNEAADTVHASVDRRPEGKPENPDPDLSGLWTLEWNGKAAARLGHVGMGGVNRPHHGILKFPMKVGDVYEFKYEISTGANEGQLNAYNASRKSHVARWEEVTVPAGTFKAIVIESEAGLVHASSGRALRQSISYWYSPEVRRWVKTVRKGWPDDIETQLISYKLQE